MKTITLFAAAAAALATPSAASAATFLFTLTGDYNASWQQSSTPTPDSRNDGQGFALERVAGDFPGATDGAAYIDYFSADNGGGLSIADADGPDLLRTLMGRQLYTGTEAMPVFRRGVFALKDADGAGYTLRVSDLAGGVPEPATWALMLLGFGAMGAAMRGRVRRTAIRFA